MISFHPPVFHPLIVFLPLAAHHFISFTQFQLEKKQHWRSLLSGSEGSLGLLGQRRRKKIKEKARAGRMHRTLTRSKGRTVSVDHNVGIGARMMTRLGRQTAEPHKVRAMFCAKHKNYIILPVL